MNKQQYKQNFMTFLQALIRPEAFPFKFAKEEKIVLKQTHASAVLLTNNYAYKIKKPEKYGFDYSTPELRRHCCQQEVILNSRLAPQVYLGIAPILACEDNELRIGETLMPDNLPFPGETFAGKIAGVVVDYAVVMQRLPEEALLSTWVAAGSADAALMREIARFIAAFHTRAVPDDDMISFGSLKAMRESWEIVFGQMQIHVGRVLSEAMYQTIIAYVRGFMDTHRSLFEKRVQEQRIRDCHGDLQLQHIYTFSPSGTPHHDFKIVDCIEFSDRFRYGDVTSEVAFLKMDLDLAGRSDLSQEFVTAYIQETDDRDLSTMLPFYACFRACIRGQVCAFQLNQPEVPVYQLEQAQQQAELLFTLAQSYTHAS